MNRIRRTNVPSSALVAGNWPFEDCHRTAQGGIAMLVLSRRLGESIVIDGGITVTVVGLHGDRVRLGIQAPRDVQVDRQEAFERRAEFGTACDEPEQIPLCR